MASSHSSSTSGAGTSPAPTSLATRIRDFITGCLIGLAELVPGISGGTVALVMGIYERVVRNGDALIDTVRNVGNAEKRKEHASKIEWIFLITVGIGMIGTVLLLSGVMHNFVDNHTENARGLFLGMVAVSIWVPISMIQQQDKGKHHRNAVIGFVVAAIITFFATGIVSAEKTDPSLLLIFCVAAIAVCALVLPGISGSYFLLAMGLYTYITGAVSDRNLTVMAVFVLGALTGIALFIKVLSYLINHHHTVTMATMAGVMLGSLRSLWPWQDDQANLLAPSGTVALPILLCVVGAAIVAAIITAEKMHERRKQSMIAED